MLNKILFLILLQTFGWGEELFVIAHKDFPKDHLSAKELKALFLDKKQFLDGKKILAINYPFTHPDRECFEKNILKKSRRNLELYWLKAHYHGKQPPKVVKSQKMLLAYLQKVDTALGYYIGTIPKDKNLKILFRIQCR